jgi:Fur family peroxide stress response transcriptional regulator
LNENYSTNVIVIPDRSDIIDAFKRCGLRCTSQRYAILEHLLRHPNHPSAESIHEAVNRTDPRASLATVYKALHALAEAGLIRELDIGSSAARFDATLTRHHHFYCERCGCVEDFPWFDLFKALPQALPGRRILSGYNLVLKGLCEHCSTSS